MGVQEAVSFLESQGLMPELDGPVQLRIGIPAYTYANSGCALALERAASSMPGRVTIHPKYSNLNTASGLALLAHEMKHQEQFETIPDFMARYAAESRRVERAGLPPYDNIFEHPAYEREVEAYTRALESGYPPGDHVPLLMHDGVASKTFVSGISNGFAAAIGIGLALGLFTIIKRSAR